MDDWISELSRLIAAEHAAEEALHAARDAVDARLAAVRAEGVSHATLAEATGLPAETVRSRIERPHLAAKAARQAAMRQLLEAAPSLTATEAARKLRTSRSQLAAMVGDGRLTEVQLEGRARKRIALDAAWRAALEARGLQGDT